MQMGTQPHYLSNVLNAKDRKEGRTEGRLFCEKSCNNICTCIFASKFGSLRGNTIQCYHKEQNLRTNSHNCLSLPGYLYFDSVLKRQNRKGGWPITALERFFKTLSHRNKSRDIRQIKLFLSELSDLISLCPLCMLKTFQESGFWKQEKKCLCFNLSLFKLQRILLYNPKKCYMWNA